MIPLLFYNIDTKYTFVTNCVVVRGIFTGSSMGMLTLKDAEVFDITLKTKNTFAGYQLEYSDIIGAGFCSESRYYNRNTLCWELNELS